MSTGRDGVAVLRYRQPWGSAAPESNPPGGKRYVTTLGAIRNDGHVRQGSLRT
jgi:hypothetical protein